MGDFISLFHTLNLSPIITLLLSAQFFFLNKAFSRIETLEREHNDTKKCVSFIKGHLSIEEN